MKRRKFWITHNQSSIQWWKIGRKSYFYRFCGLIRKLYDQSYSSWCLQNWGINFFPPKSWIQREWTLYKKKLKQTKLFSERDSDKLIHEYFLKNWRVKSNLNQFFYPSLHFILDTIPSILRNRLENSAKDVDKQLVLLDWIYSSFRHVQGPLWSESKTHASPRSILFHLKWCELDSGQWSWQMVEVNEFVCDMISSKPWYTLIFPHAFDALSEMMINFVLFSLILSTESPFTLSRCGWEYLTE